MNDFSASRLANISQDEVNKFNDEEYNEYLSQCDKIGFIFKFNGKQPGPEEASPRYYGSNKAKIFKDIYTNRWVLGPVLVLPEFEVRPVMLDKETFKKKMLELGAPEDEVDKVLVGDVKFEL